MAGAGGGGTVQFPRRTAIGPLGVLLEGMLLAAGATCTRAGSEPLVVSVTRNTKKLMPYQVLELTFQHENRYRNPLWDVTIEVTFRSPSAKSHAVGGFFYGSSRPQKPVLRQTEGRRGRTRTVAAWPCDPSDLWKARFAPREIGGWTYSYVFRNKAGSGARGGGTFRVVKGRIPRRGWVRISGQNPFRFVFEDGALFNAIGFQNGTGDGNHNGSVMDACSMEGPFRPDAGRGLVSPPAGALFARGPSMNPQNFDVYFRRFSRSGFNLWRTAPKNGFMPLYADPDGRDSIDHIRWERAIMLDEMLRMARKYGIRVMYGLFGYSHAYTHQGRDKKVMEKVKRVIKYSVDRWGAQVDFWELLNEQEAWPEWYEVTVPYLRSVDPYDRPVTTSWERPQLAEIDINGPHWYENEPETFSAWVTEHQAQGRKIYGKPVIYGEQGNNCADSEAVRTWYRRLVPRGIGGVWDPGSARRMRVRIWTAFFHEIHFIFWNTSYAKDGHRMNLWIGPEERQYVRALQDFAGRLDAGVRMAHIRCTGPMAREVQAYGLRSARCAAAYLHHFRSVERERDLADGKLEREDWEYARAPVHGLGVIVTVPQPATAYWYDPLTAHILRRVPVEAGTRELKAPPFAVDLALLVTPDGAPDIDGDGVANDEDPDDDNDGVEDAKDAFPLEAEEWEDEDGDRIGDNLDADIDADGKGDDRNNNGVPDHEEMDLDGDGVPRAGAIPWDAFPNDPKEWRDTDGDGVGDNEDPDDDGDGYSDREEREAGTDPLSPVSFP